MVPSGDSGQEFIVGLLQHLEASISGLVTNMTPISFILTWFSLESSLPLPPSCEHLCGYIGSTWIFQDTLKILDPVARCLLSLKVTYSRGINTEHLWGSSCVLPQVQLTFLMRQYFLHESVLHIEGFNNTHSVPTPMTGTTHISHISKCLPGT